MNKETKVAPKPRQARAKKVLESEPEVTPVEIQPAISTVEDVSSDDDFEDEEIVLTPTQKEPTDVEEVLTREIPEIEDEEQRDTRFKKRWIIAFVTVLVLIVASIVGGMTLKNKADLSNNSDDQNTSAPAVIDKGQLVGGIAYETSNTIGGQIADQYGDDITKTVKLATEDDTTDAEGKPATVALATYSNVPSDFDYKSSAQFFIDGAKGFDGKWEYLINDTPVDGTSSLYAIKLYDTVENPTNPAIIEVIYFVSTKNNPERNVTITVAVTAY